MKRSLLVASCVLLVSSLFTSCQKEDKNIVELTQDLTSELQKITDQASADSLAERVAVLNKRFQDASVRVFSLNGTSLVRGADDDEHEGASYSSALKALAREIGRVRASYPAASADGDVDRDRLLAAVGAANGENDPAKCTAAGLRYLQDETSAHDTPGNFPEYYGSTKLRDALSYRASITEGGSLFADSDDVQPLPAPTAVPPETPSAAAADSEDDKDDGSDASDDDDSSSTAKDDDTSSGDTDSGSSDDDSSSSSDDDSSSSDDDDEFQLDF